MNQLKTILKPLASLRLTVVLLALSIIVVFAGTWAQIDEGVWQVQRKYFHSLAFILDCNIFLPRSTPDLSGYSAPVAGFAKFAIAVLSHLRLPMPGGYSLIVLLLANLLAAHTVRFKISAKRWGILLIHAGLILLISGEVITSLFAVESQMVIDEGQTVNYASDVRSVELAVIDTSNADHDFVVAIPGKRLMKRDTISYPELPFSIRVDSYFQNSQLLGPFQAKGQEDVRATAGMGATAKITVKEIPPFSGVEARKVDAPSAYITLLSGGQNIGTYLVSRIPPVDSQEIEVGGKKYRLELRFTRHYKPYNVKLIHFAFDRYTGTNTARNYSSVVQLIDPANQTDREVKIWMNHPLRYAGETFYQQSFDEETEKTTVLQLVHNPGWMIPYISCSMVALGMLIHFGMHLLEFFRKRALQIDKTSKSPAKTLAPSRPGKLWPAIITAACVVYLFSTGAPKKQDGKFDLEAFGRIPISYEGRVMPMDSLARNSLRLLSGKSTLFIEHKEQETWFNKLFQVPAGESKPATLWLLTTIAKPEDAGDFRVVRIDHPEIVSQLNLDPKRTRFSVNEIMLKKDVIEQQARLAQHADEKKRDLYQKKMLELVERLNLYFKLSNADALYLAPPTEDAGEWKTVNDAMDSAKGDEATISPGLRSVLGMLRAFRADSTDSPGLFDSAGHDYASWLDFRLPSTASKLDLEMIMNHVDPFYVVIILSVVIFLLCCFSWLSGSETLQRSAFWVLIVTLAFHTLALVARIYIQGRPPITNLYSTAIFIGWAVGVMCLGLELVYRNGLGTAMASVMGFITCILAVNLASGSENGDTMHMMRAVLDTNLWLATHVVIINLGYSATFLAGFLAIAYVIPGIFIPKLRSDTLYRMVYGILCFAMLFSFVGTILGGIWADQSWGRFWGWDPKENGAVLIVFWNALILHARWGGLVQGRGVMSLAIFGNAVTAWSYFGTNMLGVGLHSYGFMDSAVFWLVLFVMIQLVIILINWLFP